MIEKGKRLATLGFGVPNLLKFGNVGYFPEEFIEDFDLRGMTALEIRDELLRSMIDLDGDVIVCWPAYNLMYYVDVFNNTFIKYDMEGSEHPAEIDQAIERAKEQRAQVEEMMRMTTAMVNELIESLMGGEEDESLS